MLIIADRKGMFNLRFNFAGYKQKAKHIEFGLDYSRSEKQPTS